MRDHVGVCSAAQELALAYRCAGGQARGSRRTSEALRAVGAARRGVAARSRLCRPPVGLEGAGPASPRRPSFQAAAQAGSAPAPAAQAVSALGCRELRPAGVFKSRQGFAPAHRRHGEGGGGGRGFRGRRQGAFAAQAGAAGARRGVQPDRTSGFLRRFLLSGRARTRSRPRSRAAATSSVAPATRTSRSCRARASPAQARHLAFRGHWRRRRQSRRSAAPRTALRPARCRTASGCVSAPARRARGAQRTATGRGWRHARTGLPEAAAKTRGAPRAQRLRSC